MKRGTPDHPKTRRLARALGIGIAQACGHLELLWHWTAKFAPRGDVGRYADAEIEEGAAWDGPPGALVAALRAGWLDVHHAPGVRLVVHDWHQHADDAVKKLLARNSLTFVGPCTCPDCGGTCPDAVETRPENGCLPLPLPEPCPERTPPIPPSPPPVEPEAQTAPGGRREREAAKEAVLEHWRNRARAYGVAGPDRPEGRMVWAGLGRGRTTQELMASVDELVREQLVRAGRLSPDAPWPPEVAPDRGPPVSDVCSG